VADVEFRTATYTHAHHLSLRTLTWTTLAITAVMGGLFFALGFPPTFDTFYEKMYFHSIGIGIAALLCYLMLESFGLEAYEPPIDFPLRYRAFIAVVFGALGGLLAINSSVWANLPDVGMLFFVVAFILVVDVGGALFVELLLLPRKQAGNYRGDSRNVIGYVGRLLPLRPEERAAYRGLTSAYWLAIISLASAGVAAMIGFVNLWVRAFGPSFFGGYLGWLGLDANGFLGATLDPHSHMIALAIFAGIVAVAIPQFRACAPGAGARRNLVRVGAWIAIVGVIGTTLILSAVAFLNFAPPTLFQGGPGGANGMAGDDAVMSIIFIGALVVAAGILADPESRRHGLRLAVVGTWAATVVITAVEGFWIEFHEDTFQAAQKANDAAFSAAHPMTGIFVLTTLSLVLLLVDAHATDQFARRLAASVGVIGLVAAFAGTTFWTFVDPSNSGPSYWLYIVGIAVCYLAVLAGGLVIRSVRTAAPTATMP